VRSNRRNVRWETREREIAELRQRHGRDRSLVRGFPDLSVEHNVAPCTNGMSGSCAAREQPSGMKRFPVGHSHKQGLELLTPGSDPKDFGGNKT
jgi:hypothetical protein